MDTVNLFATRTTARHLRAEFGLGMLACIGLALAHLDDINWMSFVVLFAYIDVLGYFPGALYRKLHPGAEVPRPFYVLYNVMHSMLTGALVAVVWSLLFGPQWALLALPIHFCGDRAIFGNFAKPFGLAFEPEPHPAYVRFVEDYQRATTGQQPEVDHGRELSRS